MQTQHCPGSHTAENLRDVYLNAFKKWQIAEKDIKGRVDNARNVVNAWHLLNKTCMLCFDHTMNLSVKKRLGVQGIEAVLGKCRKIVGHFNHSQP